MGIAVGIGISTEKDSLLAAQAATRKAVLQLNDKRPDLAIVFSSIEFAHSTVLKTIRNILADIPVIGCSSLAVISNAGIFKQGLIVALLSFPGSVYFNSASIQNINQDTISGSGEKLGEKLLYGLKNIRRDFSVIFSDGLIQDNPAFIYGLQEKLGKSFPLMGATASNNLISKKTYLYCDNEVFNNGACGILWGGKLSYGLGIKHGWKPLGKPRYVTKSFGNVAYEIDGAAAAETYKEYLSCGLENLQKELKRISVLYPIGIYLPGEDEYLLRNIVSIEDDGSLAFQGRVPQNSQIRLMIGTEESCLMAARSSVEEVKRSLYGRQVNLVLVFDSASRYILLRRQAIKELEIIKQGFGPDTPILGIYTYGEQAPLKAINYQGRTYFHNQTIAILGIGG